MTNTVKNCPCDRTSISSASRITSDSVRNSYLYFPRWSQPLWTLATGKPLKREEQTFNLKPATQATLTVFFVLLASILHLVLLTSSNPWQLVAGVVLTPAFAVFLVGAWRKTQVVYTHHAIHKTFFPKRDKANTLIANFFTTFALVQNMDEYRYEHLNHHRRAQFTTLQDADAMLLFRFGIQPGKSIRQLYRTVLLTMISPHYHLDFLISRLRSNLMMRPPIWIAVSAIWMAVLFIALPMYFGVLPVAIAIWLPLIFIYQMSALLQFLTEHLWLLSAGAPTTSLAYADRCIGRFCDESVPGYNGQQSSFRAWFGWWIRTIFIHIPTRFGILVGDLPAHDWHHLCGFVKQNPNEWASAIFVRQRAIDDGNSYGMETREIWGIFAMLDHVLAAMSNAPEMIEVSADFFADNVELP
jgi:hypothetical protein